VTVHVEIETADRGRRYTATVIGEAALLISGSRDPEHDACRALVRRGHEGPVQFSRRGTPTLLVKSARIGAGRCIEENTFRGPRLAKWKPHPMATAKDVVAVRA
jgi:hypothetical protein